MTAATTERHIESAIYFIRYQGDNGVERLDSITPNLDDALHRHARLTGKGVWAWVEKVERITETTIIAGICS